MFDISNRNIQTGDGNLKRIALRGNRGTGLYTMVDDEDFEFLSQFKWVLSRKGYAETGRTKLLKRYYPKTRVQMQRLLMRDVVKEGLLVDHINGDKLDNRKENLRLVTMSQSNANRGKINFRYKPDKRSKFIGVSWNRNKWRAIICKEGNQEYIGRFDNEEDAARAYNKRALELFGEYARTNEGLDE